MSETPQESGKPISLRPRRPTTTLNVPNDFSPIPLQEFVIKTYELCNLACDYCYMYEMADQTWQQHPTRMSQEVFTQLAVRIAEHVNEHHLRSINVVFHGGEPILSGEKFLRCAVQHLAEVLPDDVEVHYRIQTNGTLLTERLLESFAEMHVQVGVSLDGGKEQNDRHRRYRNNDSSYDRVERGIRLLTQPAYRHLFSRLYCTIDIDNDPIATYSALAQFNPPMIDFLLPHGNWDSPPLHLDPLGTDAPYGEWLVQIFDHWFDSGEPQPPIRYFTEIIQMLLGGQSAVETIGISPTAIVVVQTDGSIEQTDALRSAFHGAAQTGHNVFDHSLNDVLTLPAITYRQIGLAALSPTCQACDLKTVCGAGYLPHRYRAASGFDNPSVYCRDLMRLITHIDQRLAASINAVIG